MAQQHGKYGMHRFFNAAALLFGVCSLLAASIYTTTPVKNWCDLEVRDNGGTWESRCTWSSCTTPMDCGKGTDTSMLSGWTVTFCSCDFGPPYQFLCGTNWVQCRTMIAVSGNSKKIVCYDCHCGPTQGLEETADDCTGQSSVPGSTYATMCVCTTPPQ